MRTYLLFDNGGEIRAAVTADNVVKNDNRLSFTTVNSTSLLMFLPLEWTVVEDVKVDL